MTVREETQTIERLTLSPYAALSEQSFGRRTPEPEDDLRTCYQRDRDRILHCKSFRRLKQKTQVFLEESLMQEHGNMALIVIHLRRFFV